jgi:RNA polymerase sigma-70 factor (ECF subfamily)
VPTEFPVPSAGLLTAYSLEAEADEQLVHLAQQGDEAAFTVLLRRHRDEVARLLWRFAQNAADLDDLVQEVFLRLVRHLPGWVQRGPFLHWLRRVCVNVGRDHLRRQGVRSRWNVGGAEPEQTEAVHDPAPTPSARAAANEVKEFLAQLSPDDRLLLTLHYLEGWSFAEIASACGWPSPLVKVKAFRAKRRLRKLLENKP